LRPSEQIALLVSDCDVVHSKISVTKARVMARDKDRTKTSLDRLVELWPRALDVLKRQLALRARLKLAGKIDHDHLFFKKDGTPITNLQFPWVRWRRTLRGMKVRYRDPYNARHSSVSWNLMIGKNLLWVAKNHGHSVTTMLEVYAAWTEGAGDTDVAAIKQAMESGASVSTRLLSNGSPLSTPESPEFASYLPVRDHALDPGSHVTREFHSGNSGGERGTRTSTPAL
jgi:integrase